MRIQLSIEDRQALLEVFRTSFGSVGEMKMLCQFYLGENLDEHVQSGPLLHMQASLVAWCEGADLLDRLIQGMVRERPNRHDIRAIAAKHGLLAEAPPAPPPVAPLVMPPIVSPRPIYVAPIYHTPGSQSPPPPEPQYVPITSAERRRLCTLLADLGFPALRQIALFTTEKSLERIAGGDQSRRGRICLRSARRISGAARLFDARGHLPGP